MPDPDLSQHSLPEVCALPWSAALCPHPCQACTPSACARSSMANREQPHMALPLVVVSKMCCEGCWHAWQGCPSHCQGLIQPPVCGQVCREVSWARMVYCRAAAASSGAGHRLRQTSTWGRPWLLAGTSAPLCHQLPAWLPMRSLQAMEALQCSARGCLPGCALCSGLTDSPASWEPGELLHYLPLPSGAGTVQLHHSPSSLSSVDGKVTAGQTCPEAAQAAADGIMPAFTLPALEGGSLQQACLWYCTIPCPCCANCEPAKVYCQAHFLGLTPVCNCYLARTIFLGQIMLQRSAAELRDGMLAAYLGAWTLAN